jgi:excisionase family DNA binding protein
MRTGHRSNRPKSLAIVEEAVREVGGERSGAQAGPLAPTRRLGLAAEPDVVATALVGSDHERTVGVDLISIPETARRIGLHADTLYRLCRTGHFPPAIQIGGRWRVSVPRLERYLHGEDPTW